MSDNIVKLPENMISIEDIKSLESFGGHEIARGRATRFHWGRDDNGDPHFEIYRGGADEELVLSIGLHRKKDLFYALNAKNEELVSGDLNHVMAVLDKKLAKEHGENI